MRTKFNEPLLSQGRSVEVELHEAKPVKQPVNFPQHL